MPFAMKSKLVTLVLITISICVGLGVGKYDVTYGAVSMLLMYVSLAVTVTALGKVRTRGNS